MFRLETRAGEPIEAGGTRLVPIARSMRLELGRGGLVWNRAIGVALESRPEKVVPIHDRTRRLQLTILGVGLLGSLLLWLGLRRSGMGGGDER